MEGSHNDGTHTPLSGGAGSSLGGGGGSLGDDLFSRTDNHDGTPRAVEVKYPEVALEKYDGEPDYRYRSFDRSAGPTAVVEDVHRSAVHRSAFHRSAGPTLVEDVRAWDSASDADSFFVPATKTEFAAAAPAVQPFAAPKMQPFYEEDTATQFISSQRPDQICDALVSALKANDCVYDINREKGHIKLTAFVDHCRVSAVVRIYRKTADSCLVNYGRNFGERIPATRLFFTLANDSKLIQLEVPRLLRRRGGARQCCTAAAAAREGAGSSEAKAAPALDFTPTATTVFVDMLGSVFAEEALVGAQGLARECCCAVSGAPYVPHLPAIVAAFRQHQVSGCAGHLVSRDIIACLADVIALVGDAATRAAAGPRADGAVEPMLRCAASVSTGGDVECVRASLRALAKLCEADPSLTSRMRDDHRDLVVLALAAATRGKAAATTDSTSFVRTAAQRLQAVLGL